ncbi:hypothetical protein QOT17_013521 [Balamuthia mandrillaris]
MEKAKQWYESVVVENAQSFGFVESALRSLLFLSPSRLRESELAAEVAYSGVGLLTLYHDVVVLKHLQQKQAEIRKENAPTAVDAAHLSKNHTLEGVAPSPDHIFFPTDKIVQRLTVLMSVFQNIELFVEIAARKTWGERGRWRAAALVECLKVVVRLLLLARHRGRVMVHQRVRDRTEVLQSKTPAEFLEEERRRWALTTDDAKQKKRKEGWPYHNDREYGRNRRKVRETLLRPHVPAEPSPPSPNAFEHQHTTSNTHPNGRTEVHHGDLELTPVGPIEMVIGELLWTLRPMIYLVGMWLFGRKSWLPWLLSLGVDVTSAHYSSQANAKTRLTEQEQEELSRRRGLWLYYLVRSPFFEAFFTRKGSMSFVFNKLLRVPGLRSVLSFLLEYVAAYRQYYFYTAASS